MKTKIKGQISELLKENTGKHMLDSGGAYGRNWERNQQIENFDNEPEVMVDYWTDEVSVYVNIYHFLINHLEVTSESEDLNELFQELSHKSTNNHLTDMKDFIEFANEKGYEISTEHNIVNTYNGENCLSQDLQYLLFEDDWDEVYIMLQIHNGCDIRGGYTQPCIFKVEDLDYFIMGQRQITARAKEGQMWDSYDAGFTWEYVGYENLLANDKKSFTIQDGKCFYAFPDNKITFNGLLHF